MSASAAGYGTYKKVDIETASQGKLIVMLFNGAIQRAEEAKRQLERRNLEGVHNNLIRAQDIVSELRGALNMSTGEIAANLNRIYEYFQHLLVQGNVRKDAKPVDECIRMMTAMRDTWQEVFATAAKEEPTTKRAPLINPLGAASMNMEG